MMRAQWARLTNPSSSSPSEKTLRDVLSLTPAEAKQLKEALRSARGHKSVDEALDLADKLMNASGVEAINGDHHVDNYYFDIVALYVNTGDTYNPTLLYETDTGRFLATTYGDWIERNEKKYGIR